MNMNKKKSNKTKIFHHTGFILFILLEFLLFYLLLLLFSFCLYLLKSQIKQQETRLNACKALKKKIQNTKLNSDCTKNQEW